LIYIGDIHNDIDLDIFDETILVRNKDIMFYIRNNFLVKLSSIFSKNFFKKIYFKFIDKIELNYDNIHFYKIYKRIAQIKIKEETIYKNDINHLLDYIKKLSINSNFNFIRQRYLNLYQNISSQFSKIIHTIRFHPFTFLTKYNNYREVLLYKNSQIPKIFMQHGSYIQENIFLKYNEIYPADINFVFNEYTKKFFEKRGAKDVYSVGSINFNYKIISSKKYKYDFVYITYCTSYGNSGSVISTNSNLDIDANDIYKRHKEIIELFGKKFKDRRLVIKLQYGIFIGTMNYIPLIELSKSYDNIDIEFIKPLSKIFNEAKYIISDYLSSEFINRELNYKRDILLFKENLRLEDKTLQDIKKMFILIDSINDLKEKVENIEEITKDRKRYDDIIEYYSSKKCDTKKEILKILEKKLNESESKK